MLRHYKERRRRFLISTRASERIDKSASSGTVVPHLERGVEVEDIACSEAAAGAVNREHRIAVDFVEVDVFQHGASPVRQVEEIHTRLVGVHAGLDRNPAHRFAPAEEQIQIVAVAAAAFLDDLAHGDAEIFPRVLLLDGHVGDELGDVVDAQRLADLVDGQAHVGGRKRGIAGVDARRLQLHWIGGAIEVEPGAGGGGVLVILDAEERNGLRAAEAVVHEHVGGDGAGGKDIDGDGLRVDGIGGGDVASAAVGGQRGVVDLYGLPDVDERGAIGDSHREGGAGDGVDGAEDAVAGGLHQLVEKRAELLHAIGHFALRGVFDGAFAAGGGVFNQLRDFNREAEENRRDLRDVIGRAGAAPEVAAVRVVRTRFASRVDLQGQAHVAAGNFLHVAALLDHGEQNVVALVEQGHFVARLFELQRDDIRVCLCWHLFFSLGFLLWGSL